MFLNVHFKLTLQRIKGIPNNSGYKSSPNALDH